MQDIVLISIPESTIENIVARAVKKAIEAAQPKIEGESADLPELLTRKQAAKMLSISLGTLDGWSKEGRITKVRNGGIVRYRKTELLANFKSLKESRYSRNEKGGAKW